MDFLNIHRYEATDRQLLLAILERIDTMPNRDELRSAIRDEVTEALNANSAERDQLRADLQAAIERADTSDADKAAIQQAFDDYSASIDSMAADVREPGLYGQEPEAPTEPTPEAPTEPTPTEPEPAPGEPGGEPVPGDDTEEPGTPPGGVVF